MATNVSVSIRMRPVAADKRTVFSAYDSNVITQTEADERGTPVPNSTFRFDNVFDDECSTEDLYKKVAHPIVNSIVDGFNGTVFAYGQTASGKTFTMQGTKDAAGILQMAADTIFSRIEAESDTREFLLRASYVEIYNEEIRDLLNPKGAVKIREDPTKGVYLDCKEEIITNFEHILKVLHAGEHNRSVGVTKMNEHSSRSHTIFRLVVESRACAQPGQAEEEYDGAVLAGMLNLVDLAGSESVRLTGAAGKRLKEAGNINKSLLTLSRVIQTLSDAAAQGNCNPHISFRDSKLTRVLQPSLAGNCRTAIVCCCTPVDSYLEETLTTLKFAQRASNIKTETTCNELLDDASQLKRLKRELAAAKRAMQQMEEEKTAVAPAAEDAATAEEIEALREQNAAFKEQKEGAERQISLMKSFVQGGSSCFVGGGTPNSRKTKAIAKKRNRLTWCPGNGGGAGGMDELSEFAIPAFNGGAGAGAAGSIGELFACPEGDEEEADTSCSTVASRLSLSPAASVNTSTRSVAEAAELEGLRARNAQLEQQVESLGAFQQSPGLSDDDDDDDTATIDTAAQQQLQQQQQPDDADEVMQGVLDTANERIAALEEELSETVESRDQFEKAFESMEEDLSGAQDKCDEALAQNTAVAEQLASAQGQIQELETASSGASDSTEVIAALENKLAAAEAEKAVMAEEHAAQIVEVQEAQNAAEDEIERLGSANAELEQQLEGTKSERAAAQEQFEKAAEETVQLQSAREELLSTQERLTSTVSALEVELGESTVEIQRLTAKVAVLEEDEEDDEDVTAEVAEPLVATQATIDELTEKASAADAAAAAAAEAADAGAAAMAATAAAAEQQQQQQHTEELASVSADWQTKYDAVKAIHESQTLSMGEELTTLHAELGAAREAAATTPEADENAAAKHAEAIASLESAEERLAAATAAATSAEEAMSTFAEKNAELSAELEAREAAVGELTGSCAALEGKNGALASKMSALEAAAEGGEAAAAALATACEKSAELDAKVSSLQQERDAAVAAVARVEGEMAALRAEAGAAETRADAEADAATADHEALEEARAELASMRPELEEQEALARQLSEKLKTTKRSAAAEAEALKAAATEVAASLQATQAKLASAEEQRAEQMSEDAAVQNAAEDEIERLTSVEASLNLQLGTAKEQMKKGHARLVEQAAELEVRQKRMDYLDARKLTKEQSAKLMKMKTEWKSFKKENALLKAKLEEGALSAASKAEAEELQAALRTASAEKESAEAELRRAQHENACFANNAEEMQERIAALDEEIRDRDAELRAVTSQSQSDKERATAVAAQERFVAAEKERLEGELGSARQKNLQQEQQLDFLKQELDVAQRRAQEVGARKAELEAEAKQASASYTQSSEEHQRTVSFLEQENLTLMLDIKALRAEHRRTKTAADAALAETQRLRQELGQLQSVSYVAAPAMVAPPAAPTAAPAPEADATAPPAPPAREAFAPLENRAAGSAFTATPAKKAAAATTMPSAATPTDAPTGKGTPSTLQLVNSADSLLAAVEAGEDVTLSNMAAQPLVNLQDDDEPGDCNTQ